MYHWKLITMNKFTIYCAFLTVICSEGVRSYRTVDPISDNGHKIVGGEETTIQKYSYQAHLLLSDGLGGDFFQCGGSIVNEYNIVTAAHCLHGIKKITVRIGSTEANSGGIQYETTKFFTHPRYNSSTFDFDIAVIKIREGMNLNGTNASAIRMVNSGNDPQEGDNVTITGWGNTAETGTVTNILNAVEIPVVSRKSCSKMLDSYTDITSRMFCAGRKEGGKDSCQGDSGGPAVLSSNGKLAGVTSYGFGCGRPKSPGVYTRIGDMWIRLFLHYYTGI